MAEEKNNPESETFIKNDESTEVNESLNNENVVENALELILGEKGYEYYLNNKKQVTLYNNCCWFNLAILGYKLIYVKMFVEPKEKEGIEELWQSESKAFDENDWETAIYGDSLGFFKGFKELSEKLFRTKSRTNCSVQFRNFFYE